MLSIATIDIGCGDRKTEDAVGVDVCMLPGVDVVHDLNSFPYPFKNKSFDRVVMNNIIEHLDDPIRVMQEVYRILAPGGVVHIEVVYWNHRHSASDPQHKHMFNEHSWEFFTGSRKQYYTDFAFELVSLVFQYDYRLRFLPNGLKRFLGIFLCNVIAGMVVELRKPWN